MCFVFQWFYSGFDGVFGVLLRLWIIFAWVLFELLNMFDIFFWGGINTLLISGICFVAFHLFGGELNIIVVFCWFSFSHMVLSEGLLISVYQAKSYSLVSPEEGSSTRKFA